MTQKEVEAIMSKEDKQKESKRRYYKERYKEDTAFKKYEKERKSKLWQQEKDFYHATVEFKRAHSSFNSYSKEPVKFLVWQILNVGDEFYSVSSINKYINLHKTYTKNRKITSKIYRRPMYTYNIWKSYEDAWCIIKTEVFPKWKELGLHSEILQEAKDLGLEF